jgi:transposase
VAPVGTRMTGLRPVLNDEQLAILRILVDRRRAPAASAVVGAHRWWAAEVTISDLERIYTRKKAANKELNELLKATGTTLTDLHGIGPSGAARLLVEIGASSGRPAAPRHGGTRHDAPAAHSLIAPTTRRSATRALPR